MAKTVTNRRLDAFQSGSPCLVNKIQNASSSPVHFGGKVNLVDRVDLNWIRKWKDLVVSIVTIDEESPYKIVHSRTRTTI